MISNFLIIGTQRTGSTALFESLNGHPEVACGAEWPRYMLWHNKIRHLQRALSGDFTVLSPRHREKITQIYRPQIRWLGCKLLFRSSDKWLVHPRFAPALWLDRLEAYLRWLARCPDISIIHVVRCNAVEWLKSKYLAQATGVYNGEQYPDGLQLNISLPEAIKRLCAKNWIDNRLATLAESNPYLRVCYEDFLKSNHSVFVSVLQFLRCDATQITMRAPSVRRQSKGSAANYVSNYDNLVTELERRDLLCARLYK